VTLTALAGAALMAASSFATVVSVQVAGGSCEVLSETDPALADRCVQTGWERHSVVFLLLGVAAAVMAALRSRPAAVALAAFGAVALAVALLGDLPASRETGVVGESFAGANASAGAGLWLELAGGVLVLLAGLAGLAGRPEPCYQR
jgi:hypothetical protein